MIRFGVIGAGRIGKVHSATIAANPKAKLTCIADAVPKAAEELAAKYGAKVASVEEIMKAKDVDAVLIGSPTGFHADHLHVGIFYERIKQPHAIAATSHTGHEAVWQPFFQRKNLFAGFPTNHGLKIPNHHGVWMSTKDRAEQIMGRPNIGRPVTHGLANGIFECAASGIDPGDF